MFGAPVAMADDLHGRIPGGGWWISSRKPHGGESSPCSTAPVNIAGASVAWNKITRSSDEAPSSVSDGCNLFRDAAEKRQSSSGSAGSGGGNSSELVESMLQATSFGLSPPAMDWSQGLLRSTGRAESSSLHEMLHEDSSGIQTESIQVPKDYWSPRKFMSAGEESSANEFKQINEGLPSNSFPMSSSNPIYGLFNSNSQAPNEIYSERSLNFANSNEISSSWPKFSSFINPSIIKQEPAQHLQFSNNTPFWNASAASISTGRSNIFPFQQNQFSTHNIEDRPNCANLVVKQSVEEVRDSISSSSNITSSEHVLKRPRTETASSFPAFKVRKEKLGDKVTALQQLVSPFGKTDTASVLFEAIEYIKFLHGQVTALSSSYMKSGVILQYQQNSNKGKVDEGKQDLQSRGLCLVPISSTYTVANEGANDLWRPTFGGSLK